MQIGDMIHGFRTVRQVELEELSGTLFELEHEKTCAKLAWLRRDEENKTFMVGFQTLPEDDTGVFHILEHSSLCGSDKFPVKEPFVELMKSSMKTFLNAMTFPDKTVYPVSSRNPKDFMNLVRVYADAVFAPAIYRQPNIFRQEGWHYEVREGAEPLYKGVVFNEMKGAFSSVDTILNSGMNRLLFPDSCYRFVAGGDPEHIPELTYEQFLNAHRRYYHPSNALFFLDGDLDLNAVLELLDGEYLSKYERRERDFVLNMQEPVSGAEATQYYQLNPGEEPAGKTHFSLGRIVGTWADKERNLALDLLCSYLAGSNDAPLKKAILRRGLGQDLRLGVMEGIAQPWLGIQVRNTDREKCDEIRTVLRETVRELVDQGLDREELAANMNIMEFQYLEKREPSGMNMGLAACQAWLYGGHPELYLTWKETFAALREKLDTDYFEKLLEETFLDESNTAVLYTLPSATAGEETMQREAERLRAAKASWDEEALARLTAETAELETWQQTTDSDETLATLPTLRLEDVSREPQWVETEELAVGGVKVLTRPSKSGGITYLRLYFSLESVSIEELPACAFLTALLGKLPTARRDALALQRAVKSKLGGLSFDMTSFPRQSATDTVIPAFVVSCSVLDANVGDALELIREILLETDFRQNDKVRETLVQYVTNCRQHVIMNGHQIAIGRALSHCDAEKLFAEHCGGMTFLQWIEDFAKDFEAGKARLDALELPRRIFREAGLAVSVTGKLRESELEQFVGAFPAAAKGLKEVRYPLTGRASEGVEIPAGISYTGMGGNLFDQGARPSGAARVLANILSYEYLWNAVRVQGGAYGTGFAVSGTGDAVFYSYRDPNPARSLQVYRQAADFVRSFCQESGDLTKQIIGTVSAMEPLQAPADIAGAADELYFRGIDRAYQRRLREEILSTSWEDLLALCGVLDRLVREASVCVVGHKAALDACGEEKLTLLGG